jgi:hypothetical protein
MRIVTDDCMISKLSECDLGTFHHPDQGSPMTLRKIIHEWWIVSNGVGVSGRLRSNTSISDLLTIISKNTFPIAA